MSDTPSESDSGAEVDVDTVLVAADRYLSVSDHQSAYDLLTPLHEGGSVAGEDLGRTSFLLGEACLGLDGLDAAMYYYEEAAQHGSAETQQQAQARIAEIGRRDDAVDAADEGVEGEQEAEAVLRAAEDALANHDFETAGQYFTQAYDGIQMTNAQISRASLGLAECHAAAGENDQAEGYLQVAESADASALTERIAALRARMAEVSAGEAAGADGVERTELDELHEAGLAAARTQDWEGAYGYFQQIYESGMAPATQRGRAAMNLGICCLYTHDYDAAVGYLTEASNTAHPDLAAKASEILTEIEQLDQAEAIVDRIDPDRYLENQ
jgi:hypothetical protein